MLSPPFRSAKHPLAAAGPGAAARVELDAAPKRVPEALPQPEAHPPLPAPDSEARWRLLQRLRRQGVDPRPWLERLERGALDPEPDLLATLAVLVDRAGAERLLALARHHGPDGLRQALAQELPGVDGAASAAWLEPLLSACALDPVWLVPLGRCREPRVAQRLREAIVQALEEHPPALQCPPAALIDLLPLLGQQRQGQDAALLISLALDPAPLALRRAALEGLALGLAAWPQAPLGQALARLAQDLDPALAAKAVDLLARLPAGQTLLHRLARSPLEASVRARLGRRLRFSPLVLLVHGRSGGRIPAELEALAQDLAARRGAPVLLQALTAPAPEADPAFWAAARTAGALTLVPLLLLPGGHVRHDLPAIAERWRCQADAAGVALRRRPFLGAWPAWQRQLAARCAADRQAGLDPLWLHHPLEGHLAARYLGHLRLQLAAPGLATPYSAQACELPLAGPGPVALLPMTLASNRLSETLKAAFPRAADPSQQPPVRLHPPLLQQAPVRQFLIDALEVLP
ncbi:CbiX/SirB N-terminal domain-containing protein [Vulcanococcus limneticus]|uniref:CbiX/SirB N-terminal domain-containing protein n=1 Tax=Vulcanococcus limneticus TaxID=2170428 RepID=UPI00398C0B7E